MEIHPRVQVVEAAQVDLAESFTKIVLKHQLTYLEGLKILMNQALRLSQFALRDERHPDDPTRKADEA